MSLWVNRQTSRRDRRILPVRRPSAYAGVAAARSAANDNLFVALPRSAHSAWIWSLTLAAAAGLIFSFV